MATQIREFVGQELIWIPIGFNPLSLKGNYQLVAGTTALATLDMSNWATTIATMEEERFIITHEGRNEGPVTIRTTEFGPALAVYNGGLKGGTLHINNHLYRWENLDFFQKQKAWMSDTGTPFIHLQIPLMSGEVRLSIDSQAADIPELSLLVIMSLYLVIMNRRNMAIASGGIPPA